MKVFIDTNVWLSGRFWPGLCAELLDSLIKMDVTVLLDECVHEEFRRFASEKFKVDVITLEQTDVFFNRHAIILPRAEIPMKDVPDPDDAWILAAALAANADWFVTGDKALLEMCHASGMPIVHPRQAYLRLKGLN